MDLNIGVGYMLAIVYCFCTLVFLNDFLADANRFFGRLVLDASFFPVEGGGGFGLVHRFGDWDRADGEGDAGFATNDESLIGSNSLSKFLLLR